MITKIRNIFIDKIKRYFQGIYPQNPRTGLIGLFFALGTSALFTMIIYMVFRNGNQTYTDIVFGDITFSGIYKNFDFILYYSFLLSFLLFFPLCLFFLNKTHIQDKESSFHIASVLLALLPIAFIASYKLNISQFAIRFIFYVTVLCFLGKFLKYSSDEIIRIACNFFSLYLSASGILALCQFTDISFTQHFSKYFDWIVLFLFICMFGLLCLWGEKNIYGLNWLSRMSQILIPLNLLVLVNTKYFYQGNEYVSPYMQRLSMFICFIIVALILINILYRSGKQHCFNLITLSVFTAAAKWNPYYNLLINTDPFHTGETAVVWQQIFEIGQKWNQEFVSALQGLGLVYSGINEILFGGDFSAYQFSENLITVICAVLITVCLFFLVDKKWIVLIYAAVQPLLIMNRIYLVGIVFLFLCNGRLIKRPMLWTFSYAMISLVHIWYQPTYGGVTAVALLFGLMAVWFPQLRKTALKQTSYKENRSLIIFTVFLVLLVIVCMPMLLDVLHFMRVNGYETQVTNGISISQALFYPPQQATGLKLADYGIAFLYKYFLTSVVCLIMIYFFFIYVIKEEDFVLRVRGTILSISSFVVFILCLPAVLTRIDGPGLSRIGWYSVIITSCLFPMLVYFYWNKLKFKNLTIVLIGICFSVCIYINVPALLTAHQKVTARVEVPSYAAYYNGEELGLSRFGEVFTTDKRYVEKAVALREVFDALLKPEQTYYDMSDNSIYYLYTGRKVPGKYVSSMVAANELIHNEALEQLEKHDVPIVFANDPLFPNLSNSIRYYRIYRYFLSKDYRMINYKGNKFLVRGDVDLSPIQNGISNEITNVMGISAGQAQSLSTISSPDISLNKNNIVYTSGLSIENESIIINDPGDPFAVYNYEDTDYPIPVSGISMIELTMSKDVFQPFSAQFFIESDRILYHSEDRSIRFNVTNKHILIFVNTTSALLIPGNLKSIRFDVDYARAESEYCLESINIYTVNDTLTEWAQEAINSERLANTLNDRFYIPNLAMLPSEWGRNFNNMKQRFTLGKPLSLQANSSGQTELIPDFHQKDSDLEFLLLKTSEVIYNNQNVVINVLGINAFGLPFSLPISFDVSSGNSVYLIPFGSAPTLLRAQSIEKITVISEDGLLRIQDAFPAKLVK